MSKPKEKHSQIISLKEISKRGEKKDKRHP
jgi:hypothetical protein